MGRACQISVCVEVKIWWNIMALLTDLSAAIRLYMRSILYPEITPIAYKPIWHMDDLRPPLIEHNRCVVVQDSEQKVSSLHFLETALRLPRDWSVKSEHILVFWLADRYGRTLVITELVEFECWKSVQWAYVELRKSDLIFKQSPNSLLLSNSHKTWTVYRHLS